MRVGEPPADAQRRFSQYFTTWLGAGEFLMTSQTMNSLTYTRSRFHTWQIVVAILFFPIGVFALLAEKQQEHVSVLFRELDGGKTEITISGGVAGGKGLEAFTQRVEGFDPATRSGTAEPPPSG